MVTKNAKIVGWLIKIFNDVDVKIIDIELTFFVEIIWDIANDFRHYVAI